MKVAVVTPAWPLPPSGGRAGLHVLARELRDHLGLDAFSVGSEYEFEDIGDTVVPGKDYQTEEDTILIVPEGCYQDTYYQSIILQPHAACVVYAQNSGMVGPHQLYETHYWGLGPQHNEWVRKRMGIPDYMPIEELFLPLDVEWWSWSKDPVVPNPFRIPGSILYYPRRGETTLDAVARRCGNYPVFRVNGAEREQVRQLLAQADIFVLASQTEGQSVAANEAMAMECAVVTWTSAGMPDVITHGVDGLLVEQDDVVGLVDCVQKLQKDPDFARFLGTNARKRAQELFSMDRFRKSLEVAWANVVSTT